MLKGDILTTLPITPDGRHAVEALRMTLRWHYEAAGPISKCAGWNEAILQYEMNWQNGNGDVAKMLAIVHTYTGGR